jgi:hypothetical protein
LLGHQETESLVNCSSVLIRAVCQRKGQYKASSVMKTMNKKRTRCTIVLKSIKLIVFLFRSTCFGHSCAHHQEPPNSAHTASNHHVSLGWLYLPALVCHYCCFRDRPKLEYTSNPTTRGDWRLYVQNWEAPDDGRKSARNM